MKQRKQSSTSHPILFLMVLSSDHETGATGLTPTVTLSKDGGAFAAASGAVTEIGNGWYALAGNATDRNTLGELAIHATAATADATDDKYVIVPWDTFDGNLALTGLAGLTSPTAGALPTVGTGTGQINVDGAGNASANVVNWAGSAVSGLSGGSVPANVLKVNGTAQTAVNLGLVLPGVAPGANGGLPTVDANNNIHGVQPGTGTGQINPSGGKVPATMGSGDYSGNTVQSGDSFARIGATGNGLTSVAPAATALSNATWTNALATAINTLAGHDPGGTLASAASQTSILNAVGAITTNTARTGITVPQFVPLPASGTSSVRVKIKLFNLQGALEDADTNTVTIHASDHAGTSLDANLSSTTATRDSAGQYHVDYTVHSTDSEGGVYLAVTYTVGGVSMAADAVFSVAQADTVTSIANILSTVNTINSNVGTAGAGLTNLGDTRLAHLDANVSSRMATFSLPTNFSALAIDTSGDVTFNNTSIGTVTTLTNLPTIPANWLTAAGIAAGALDGKGDWLLASGYTAPDNADIALIKAKTDNLPASPAAVGSAMTLAANGLDAVLVESGIVAGAGLTNDAGTQLTTINARQGLALCMSVLCGVDSGGGTGAIIFRPAGNPAANARVTTSGADNSGNRGSVNLKVPT